MVIAFLFLICCILNIFINGLSVLNIIYLVITIINCITVIPVIHEKFFKNNKINLLKYIIIICVVFFSGFITIQFDEEDKLIDEISKIQSLVEEQKYIKAQSMIDNILKEDSGNVDLLIIGGVVNLKQENFDQAFTYLNKAYEISPYNDNVLYNISVAKYKQYSKSKDKNQLQNALKVMEELVEKSPRLYSANLFCGQIAIETEDYKKAKYYLSNAKILAPKTPLTYYYLSKLEYSIYEYKSALSNIKYALKNNPGEKLKIDLTNLESKIKKESGGVFNE